MKKKPAVTLSNEVECDEAYVTAGHKGQPEVVKSKERQGRRRRLQGKAGRGTLEKERPPVFGMLQRGGQVVINLLANVKQKTIEPLINSELTSCSRNTNHQAALQAFAIFTFTLCSTWFVMTRNRSAC